MYPEGKLRNQILKHAYDTNAYDIQAEGNLVRHKIMVSIGLEKKNAKEKQLEEKAYNKVMGLFGAAAKWNRAQARHGAGSRSARAAMSEVGKALNSTSKSTAAEKSDGEAQATASSWADQIIMEDLRDVFTEPWKTERLSPTKFRMTFVNDEGVPTYQYELEYINDKAFHCITEENMIFPDNDSSVFDEFIKYKDAPVNRRLTVSDKSVRADSGTSADWEIYVAVEQQAQFPGGQAALMKWISDNIMYPSEAKENNIEGRVIVKFVMEKDGSITGITVAKSVDESLDAEAMRLINKMPQWLPAQNDNTPVRSYYTLPVTFKLPK